MSTEQRYIVEEGAKVSQIIIWLLYLSGTSEMYRKRFHVTVKAQIFPCFPCFLQELQEGRSLSQY